MLASDETHVTLTGRKMHPIYLFLGNYHRWFKDQQSGWALLGFQPIIRAKKGFENRTSVREYKRLAKRWVMDMLVKDITHFRHGYMMPCVDAHGLPYHRLVYPRMPFFVGDEPEIMASVTAGYRGACSRPCTNCMVCPSDWEPLPDRPYDNPLMTLAPARSMRDVTRHYNWQNATSRMPPDISDDISIHPEFNTMFSVPGMNPFNNPSCRMHQTDHGIFKNMLDLTVSFYKKFGYRGSVETFNMLWGALRIFPGMKRFNRGVSDLAYVTANHHRSMCLPFVCRGMEHCIDTSRCPLPKLFMERCAITYLSWRWVLGAVGHTASSLDALELTGQDLQSLIARLTYTVLDKIITEGPKYHKIAHWPEWIRLFGCTGNYNAEVFECAHRFTVKKWQGSLSFTGSNAERRVMLQTAIYDGHVHDGSDSDETRPADMPASLEQVDTLLPLPIPQPPTASRQMRRIGPAGFRGKINLQIELGLSNADLSCVRAFEASAAFPDLALEHMMTAYTQMLPHVPDEFDIFTVMSILQSSDTFQRLTPVLAGREHLDDGFTRFFASVTTNLVQFYRKSWCVKSEAYVSYGSDVVYCHHSRRVTHKYGRVRWMFLVGDRQFIILQCLKEIKSRDGLGPVDGEDPVERLSRQSVALSASDDDAVHDSVRMHCLYLKLQDQYDIVHVNGPDEDGNGNGNGNGNGEIDVIIMTQPDLTTCNVRDGNTDATHFFLVEYVLQ